MSGLGRLGPGALAVLVWLCAWDAAGTPEVLGGSSASITAVRPGAGSEVSLEAMVEATEATDEQVCIDDVCYPVPATWQGKRLEPRPKVPSDLEQLPRELSFEGRELYLRRTAVVQLAAMARAAQVEGVELLADSTYRSIRYQRVIFRREMAKGRDFAAIARYVAPPGYSEHMLGTVVDFHPSDWRFADTAQYRWLKEHAAAYGFVESLPRHDQGGLPWEAWHWRYVGATVDSEP
jgi:LAS superfamily LD-carboxypeptidase LdcB